MAARELLEPPVRILRLIAAREALRQRVIVACALGDGVAARKAYDIWLAKGEPSTARKEAMWRFFQRCHDGALAERGVGSAGVATPP